MLSLPHSIPLFIQESSHSGNRGVARQQPRSCIHKPQSPQSGMQVETLQWSLEARELTAKSN